MKGVVAGTEHNEDSESNGGNGEDKWKKQKDASPGKHIFYIF